MIIFGLYNMVIMMFVMGIAIDVMRFELRRTTLQATLDRAVLAAADRNQKQPCLDVIQDWFTKAGENAPASNQVQCLKDDFGTKVSAKSAVDVQPWFMDMFTGPNWYDHTGTQKLTALAAGTAEERVGSVEVSLVLDVSGSMNGSRIDALKPAASGFVDQLFDSIEPGKLSMSIVSYSTQVSVGEDLFGYFWTTHEHDYSHCIEFSAADFNNTYIQPQSTPKGQAPGPGDHLYQQNAHFNWQNSILLTPTSAMHCPPNDAANANRDIIAFSGDRDALKTRINSLVASGNTSIDIGMKWGTALLDPAMRPVVTGLINEGKVSNAFAGRPLDSRRADGSLNSDVLKVVVLMTDGENTTEYKIRRLSSTQYTEGASRLYINDTTSSSYTGSSWYKRLSLYDGTRSSNRYYSYYTATWRSEPWGTQATDISGNDTTRQMTWPEVWATMSVNWFADNLIYRTYGWAERDRWRISNQNAVESTNVNYSAKDSQTNAICTAAKGMGAKVFTIAFEAPTTGQTLLLNCASSPAHYYAAGTGDIDSVFASIANSINKLRLTN